MRPKKVEDILLPLRAGTPLDPSVVFGDNLMHAVELMLKSNVNRIVVVRNQKPIGMLCLEDAFHKLGLQMPTKL